MQRASYLVIFCVLFSIAQLGSAQADPFVLSEHDKGVRVDLNGELFTDYLTQSGCKPILWPIIGPTGAEMTRAYPMVEGRAGERSDHKHHRSFWFTHDDVNGVNFWHEKPGSAKVVHREFVEASGGKQGTIVTRNDWVDPDGKKVCEDERRLTFGVEPKYRWIDFAIQVIASEGPVRFGDTKEGTFGVRVAAPIKVDAQQEGTIVNSRGQTNKDAWGKPATWVDYHGRLDKRLVGVAILNHPSSFRHPTHWHVRTYGLFAANPFGLRSFSGSDAVDGSHTIPAGDSLRLRYRVLFHEGDHISAQIAEIYQSYAAEPAD